MRRHRENHKTHSRLRPVTTGALAKMLGIHPNTLRWYESAGYLPPVPRTPGGYRQYAPELVRLARVVRESQPLLRMFGPIRRGAQTFLRACREDCLGAAQGRMDELRTPQLLYADSLRRLDEVAMLLRNEHRLALDALNALERFRRGDEASYHDGPLRYIGQIAPETGVTRDQIINWERDGLCRYPRNPAGYRLFGAEETARLLIIRSCRTAGYSVTSIRRLLRAIDEAPQTPGEPGLRLVADTPADHETDLFSVFPTDTLPATLEGLIVLTERLDTLLRDPSPECDKPSN